MRSEKAKKRLRKLSAILLSLFMLSSLAVAGSAADTTASPKGFVLFGMNTLYEGMDEVDNGLNQADRWK
jgi:hypothetical protein